MSVENSDGDDTSHSSEQLSTAEGSDSQEGLGPREFLGYRILRERENQDDSPTSRSCFWKLCCLADRYLIEELDRDIGFPRHWYKYGEVGEPHSLNRDIINAPRARFWEGQELYSDRDIPATEFDITEGQKRDIVEAATQTVEKHGKKSANELKRYQYEKQAPNEFIETYSRLRVYLGVREIENREQQQGVLPEFDEYANKDEDYVEALLDRLLTTYPRERYENIYRLYLRWDDTMRMLIENDAPISDQKAFLELFVERLSEITLRFEHNHAIPAGRIEDWEEERQGKIETLNEDVEEVRQEYLSQRSQSGELEAVADLFDDEIIENLL